MRLTVLAILIAVGPAYAGYSVINDSPRYSVYPKWIFSRITATNGWQPSLDVTEDCKLSFSSPELMPEKCEAHYKLNFWESFLSKLYVHFDISDQTKFQRVQFEPQPGLKIRGLLGLHSENGQIQKKPLLILRLGIYGNIDEFLAERFLARIAYEELGFHLLVIESLTSHGNLTINQDYTIGGIEEGLHTFYILNMIRHQKLDWSKDVSEVYLTGVSLSGPGVFIANYLDEHSLIKGKKKTPDIKAIELYCPLVNFEETYKQHTKAGLFSASADIWNRIRLKALRVRDQSLEDLPWWKTFFDLKPRFMPQALEALNLKRGQPLFQLDNFKQFPNLTLPKEFVDHVNKSKTLYELNAFWNFYKNEETPIHIYLTPGDPLVMNELNSDLIKQKKQPGVFNKVSITDLSRGTHCALAAEYQWPFLVEMIRRDFVTK